MDNSNIQPNNLWEEKNLTEPKTKSCNETEKNLNDTMTEIEKQSVKKEWNDTSLPKTGGIYKILNKINGKYYIGSTKNFKKRWYDHKNLLNARKHPNRKLQNAWNFYGKDTFEYVIIENLIDGLLIVEQEYLDIARENKKRCYNLSFIAGRIEHTEEVRRLISESNRVREHSDETRKKMSISAKNKKVSIETRKKMSKIFSGEGNSFYGKTHTDEAKLKIGNANRGRKFSEESRKKMSTSVKVRQFGENNPIYDTTIYKWYNKSLNLYRECTQYQLRKEFNLHRGNVSSLIKNRVKSCKGWILVK
jgi:NUMOD3 motif/GIY-YIG catalytic domain